MQEKFEFSKISSREANPPPEAATSAPPAALETVKAEASKAATGGAAAKANPLEGDLMETLLARSTGGLRYTHSNTNHAWVGTPSGEPDLASVLRAAPVLSSEPSRTHARRHALLPLPHLPGAASSTPPVLLPSSPRVCDFVRFARARDCAFPFLHVSCTR